MQLLDRPIYRVGEIEIDPGRSCLRRAGQEQMLRQKSLQVLLYLIEHRERLVSKEELLDKLWEGVAVTDDTLVQTIVELRKLLGDDSRQPRFIRTVPKAGYRFIGPVEELLPHPATLPSAAFEVEEITAVQVEYAEELQYSAQLGVQPAAQLAALPPATALAQRNWRQPKPVALAGLGIGLVALTLLSVFYFSKRWQPTAEVALPRVPGKRAVAVLYFENQSGDSELDWLREGLADMLITNLARSRRLTLLSRQQLAVLLERSGRAQAEKLRLEDGLEIARRSQAELIVLGSFAKLGQRMRVDVQLFAASNGQMQAAESLVVEQPSEILSHLNLLSLKLAAHLGAAPSAAESQPGLSGVMTGNLEAYRYYSLAISKLRAFHSTEAIQLLEKAVALDPQFAMAIARIGYIYAVAGGFSTELEKGKRYLERAFQLSHRLTDRDRLYLTAWYAGANSDRAGSIQSLREITQQYPHDIEAYYRLSYTLSVEARLAEAIEVIKQGLVMDPEAPDLYNRLGFCYSELGRYDEALNAHQRYVQLLPQEANAYDSLGLTYLEMGRAEEALSAFDRALTLQPDFHFAIMHMGDVYFGQGRYGEAAAQYERSLPLTPASYHRGTAYRRLAALYMRKGDLARAEAAAQQGVRHLNGRGAFLVALARGELSKAEKLKARYMDLDAVEGGLPMPINDRFNYYCRGLLALASGRADEALAHFREALRRPPLTWNVDGAPEDCLAEAYLSLGRLDEAIAEYERILRLNPRYALAYYHLGQAYERKGERHKAHAAYKQFLQLWQNADADVPEVIEAKQRLSTL